MKRSRIAAAALASTAFFFVSPALAVNTGTDTGDIAVSLTVDDECVLLTEPLDFGTTGVVDADVTATADIVIECTRDSAYEIALDAGDHASVANDVDTRNLFMTGGNSDDILHYQLYTDGAFSDVWGHTIGGDTVARASATGADETHTIHAKIPTHQNAPAGAYTDTITATIWYGEDVD